MNTITQIRHVLGLTQPQLGAILGYTDRQVRKWESGQVKAPKLVIEAMQRLLSEKKEFRNLDVDQESGL